jgi:hypothetical protein
MTTWHYAQLVATFDPGAFKWKYVLLTADGNREEFLEDLSVYALNRVGADGWELVSSSGSWHVANDGRLLDDPALRQTVYTFKRPAA